MDKVTIPSFWADHRVISCSDRARLVMRCLQDIARDGRCTCTAKQLRCIAFAGLDDVTDADVEQYLGELWSRCLIERLSDHDIRLVDEWKPVREMLTDQTSTAGSA